MLSPQIRSGAVNCLAAALLILFTWAKHSSGDLSASLDWDELDYASATVHGPVANAMSADGTNTLRHFHPPGLQYLAWTSLKIFGPAASSFRFPSFLLATLLPAVLFLMLRGCFAVSWLPAFSVAFLLAAFPVSGAVAYSGRHFSLVGATNLFVACAAAGALQSRRNRGLFLWAASLLAASLAFEYVVILLAISGGCLLMIRNPWLIVNWRRTAAATALIVACAGAAMAYTAFWPAGITHGPFNFVYYSLFYREQGHAFLWDGKLISHPPVWAGLWYLFQEVHVAILVLLASVVFALTAIWRSERSDVRVLSAFAAGLFTVSLLQHQMPQTHYSYYWVPIVLLNAGMLLSRSSHPNWISGIVMAVAIPLVMPVQSQVDAANRAEVADDSALLELSSFLENNESNVFVWGVPSWRAEFFLNGGFRRSRGRHVRCDDMNSITGTRQSLEWMIGDQHFPVHVDSQILRMVRLSGQRGENICKIDPTQRIAVAEAQIKAGSYTHGLFTKTLSTQ